MEQVTPGVSRETEARLRILCDAVRRWNPRINLVAESSIAELWQRHVLDSAQLVRLAPQAVRRWADLGSGAGFPGLVVAACLADRMPAVEMILVESDRRKAVFLRETARAMGVTVHVEAERAEALPPIGADVVSARAVAPLRSLLPLVRRHLSPNGVALLPKGNRHGDEYRDARKRYAFDCAAQPSATEPGAVVLLVTEIRDA